MPSEGNLQETVSRSGLPTRERVSIIIPVRNEEEKIGLLLRSILQQSAHFDEVVITDGTSADRTCEIIDEFRARDARMRLIVRRNSRCGEGRNHAMRMASGDIFVFLDAGMIPDPNWLERILKCFSSDNAIDFVFGRAIFDVAAEGVPQSSFQRIVGCVGYPGPKNWVKTVPASGARRRLWEAWEGFPEAIVGEDVLLFKKLDREGVRCQYIKDAVVRYFDFPGSYRAVWHKWFDRVKVWVQFPEMRRELFRKLASKGGVILGLASLFYLGLKDPRWLFVVPLILLGRVFLLARRHRRMFRVLLRTPTYWLRGILVSVTIDFARICSLGAACVESLGRWWRFTRLGTGIS